MLGDISKVMPACLLSCVRLFAILWTVVCQAPLFMEFSRQEYWSGLLFSSPGYLPDSRIKLASPASPALSDKVMAEIKCVQDGSMCKKGP